MNFVCIIGMGVALEALWSFVVWIMDVAYG